jgi:YYY domain-containing protein
METIFALRWYLVLQLFGLAALPLTLRLFHWMPGRGYAFARSLGLMVGGYLFWILSVFGWLPNTPGGVVAALLMLALAGIAWTLSAKGPRSSSPATCDAQPETSALRPASWSLQHILIVEALFALAFALWCVVRAHMPRIETAGGEKWMEIAFLNAVLRAPRLPPQDPWLSGFAISYYYFGYVMMGMLTHLAAVPSTIAFNLSIATLFALTVTGAYGLLYALLAHDGERTARWGALLGPLMVALVGNLEGALEVLHARGLLPAAFWKWLDIRSINVAPPPFAEGSWMPNRFMWWWQASRVLRDTAPWHTPANPAEWEVIDEFPAFSFILGDMHPHLLSLPFALLALALALNLFFAPQRAQRLSLDSLIPLILSSLCLGGMGFLNTWDLPVYFAVLAAAFLLATGMNGRKAVVPLAILPLAILLLAILLLALLLPAILLLAILLPAILLYLPFWLGLRSQASGILPNLFNPTHLPQFLVMFGPLLFPIIVWTVGRARKRQIRWRDITLWTLAIVLGLLFLLLLAVLVHPQGRFYLTALRSGSPIPGLENIPDAPRLIAQRLQERFLFPWTALFLTALLVTALIALWGRASAQNAPSDPRPASCVLRPASCTLRPASCTLRPASCTLRPASCAPRPAPCDLHPAPFISLLIAVGAALTLAVEFFYVRDHFGTRMNTVFKFYFQAWTMWGIAGAYALARIWSRGPRWAAWVSAVLVALGLIYPALAIPTRAREYGGPPTLDGAAHLRSFYGADMAAIDWLNAHVEGTPVILEAPGDRYRAYIYEGRVSAFTGLPTLLGWGGHEHQWRGDYNEPARREPDIQTLYTTTDTDQALTLLRQYGIQYVYIGLLEQSRYPPDGLAKFAQIGQVVYDAGGVRIYRIP